VAEYCTCGALLPEDARFCHKCGKPQREEPQLETEIVQPVIPAAPVAAGAAPSQPLVISFHNSVAVRVAFFAAGIISVLLMLPVPAFLSFLWQLILLIAGGFFSVYLYGRRTGQSLTVGSGARMGWITGVFCFVYITVLFTVIIAKSATEQGVSAFFKEMVSAQGTPDMVEQFNAILQSKSGVASLLFGILMVFFVMLTILPAVGGALGAKVLEKE
jgi:hypothetical protein